MLSPDIMPAWHARQNKIDIINRVSRHNPDTGALLQEPCQFETLLNGVTSHSLSSSLSLSSSSNSLYPTPFCRSDLPFYLYTLFINVSLSDFLFSDSSVFSADDAKGLKRLLMPLCETVLFNKHRQPVRNHKLHRWSNNEEWNKLAGERSKRNNNNTD